jgi:hypothetical protein
LDGDIIEARVVDDALNMLLFLILLEADHIPAG